MYEVFGFYRFLNIKYLKKNKRLINEVLIKNNIRGTVIISKEGVNGTISGKGPYIKTTINKLKKILKFKNFNSFNNSLCKKNRSFVIVFVKLIIFIKFYFGFKQFSLIESR